MEEEMWLLAAQSVLSQSQAPLHYTNIKKIILEQGLVNPGLKTTLEDALFKEIQRPGGRFQSILGQPGVFGLVKSEIKSEVPDSPKIHVNMPLTPKGHKVMRVKVTAGTSHISKVTGTNSSNNLAVQQRYRTKYKKLRKQIKDLIFINGAVCDEVISIEEKVQKVKDERRYLLTRLLQHQAVADSLLPPPPAASAVPPGGSGKHSAQSIAQILGEVEKRKKRTQPGLAAAGKKKTAKEILDDSPKPKPKKSKTASGRRLVYPFPLDSLGRPIFPFELGSLTVYCVGEIVPDRSGFHSSEYIFPVGYCSTRVYASIRSPEERCLYTCKIQDTGTGPKFDISPEDAPELVFSGFSASECHLKLLRAINHNRPTEVVPLTARGEDFFGLSHPSVQNLIQSCPGAKKCSQYKWIRFEMSKVPLPEHCKNEATVDIDALYSLPAFSHQKSQQTQASLRSLLTTTPS